MHPPPPAPVNLTPSDVGAAAVMRDSNSGQETPMLLKRGDFRSWLAQPIPCLLPLALQCLCEQRYLWSQTSLNESDASKLVDILRDSSFEQRTLCASGSNWSLTPLILTQAARSFDNNVQLLSRETCSDLIQSLTGNSIVMDKGDVIEIDDHQFIDLP